MRALHPKVLREMRDYFQADCLHIQKTIGHRAWQNAIDQLDAALKPKRSAAPAKQRRQSKKAEERAEWEQIRAAVLKRSEGACENCGMNVWGGLGEPQLECDHMFGGAGRRKTLQSIYTCWALCPTCHRQKTNNAPSAEYWLAAFIGHCKTWAHECVLAGAYAGYSNAASIAQASFDSLRLSSELPHGRGRP